MPDFSADAQRHSAVKIALRSRLLARRRSLSTSTEAKAAAAVQAATIDLVRSRRPQLAAAYVPIMDEPGGPGLPDAILSALPPGSRLLLPILLSTGDLDWAEYLGTPSESTVRALAPGPRGLREPAGPRLGPGVIAEAELVIVPALAVDRSGMRMGRGGGSYDRALARAGKAFSVALLHDGEMLDIVPAEPHDRPVHAVITPGLGLTLLRAR
jgi:5-formyltetrahydrofolate cyclo-ligase